MEHPFGLIIKFFNFIHDVSIFSFEAIFNLLKTSQLENIELLKSMILLVRIFLNKLFFIRLFLRCFFTFLLYYSIEKLLYDWLTVVVRLLPPNRMAANMNVNEGKKNWLAK